MAPSRLTLDSVSTSLANGRSAADFLIVPGIGDSGSDHWQTQWQRELQAERVQQRDWRDPDIGRWAKTVEDALSRRQHTAVLIAHSFGCLASVVAAARRPDQVQALFLAAPADPKRLDCTDDLMVTPPVSTVVVASRNDPHMGFEQAIRWSQRWNAGFVDAGATGHINADSGHSSWTFGLSTSANLGSSAHV